VPAGGERGGGPAGKLLDRALEEAGIERDAAYITNLVAGLLAA
jgi:uracil-DNA glycosylase